MSDRLFSIEGRVALVTGGSRGIGRMIAEAYVARGARVYISSRKADVCDRAAAEISAGGGSCISLPQDIATVEGVEHLAARLRECEPKLDILVNNAGAAWLAPIDEFPEAGWDKTVDLNMKSPFFLTKALLGELRAAASEQTPAKVINIASIDGMRPNPQETYAYQASKAGLIHLTRRLAAQLIRDNICVTAIAPGAFPSEMNRDARDDAATVAKRIPAGRVGGAEDIQGLAVFLASRAGDYVVGATIPADGGVALAQLGI